MTSTSAADAVSDSDTSALGRLVPSHPLWPASLPSDRAIAEYVDQWASDDVDVELVESLFEGCYAQLRMVPLAQLVPGDANQNTASPKKSARYSAMPAETRPPILVDENDVHDGNHRMRDALAKRETEILCYVVEELDSDSQQPPIERFRA